MNSRTITRPCTTVVRQDETPARQAQPGARSLPQPAHALHAAAQREAGCGCAALPPHRPSRAGDLAKPGPPLPRGPALAAQRADVVSVWRCPSARGWSACAHGRLLWCPGRGTGRRQSGWRGGGSCPRWRGGRPRRREHLVSAWNHVRHFTGSAGLRSWWACSSRPGGVLRSGGRRPQSRRGPGRGRCGRRCAMWARHRSSCRAGRRQESVEGSADRRSGC